MKVTDLDPKIHILTDKTNIWNFVKSVTKNTNEEDPFYVCDISDIVKKLEIWNKEMPRIEPHYAVKCNDSFSVIKTLAALNVNFDCASKGEIAKVLSLGVDPNKIIFANSMKPPSHISYAEKVGVNLMTFDSETELQKISKLHPNAKLVIRIKCDDPEVKYQMGRKFGCNHATEAPELLQLAKSLGLNVVGVSFHIGSGMKNPPVFHTAIGYSREVFDVSKMLGFNFTLLDVGGGYPGEKGTSIKEIAKVINSALEEYFPDPKIRIISEPGRFFVASAYTLACSVHSIRKTKIYDQETMKNKVHNMYYINDGIFGSFYYVFYDNQQAVPKCLKDGVNGNLINSSVWGPTCDGSDKISTEVFLPELTVGDWLIFEDMGAYTLPLISEFNGFPAPNLYAVSNKSTWKRLKHRRPFEENQFITNYDINNIITTDNNNNIC